MDVSKAPRDVRWLRDVDTMKVKSKKLGNTPEGHQALLGWAQKPTGLAIDELRFVREATGVYHQALA